MIGTFGFHKWEAETFQELYDQMKNTANWYIKKAHLSLIERDSTMHRAYLDAAMEIIKLRDDEVTPFLGPIC
jgi:hypothetical protein